MLTYRKPPSKMKCINPSNACQTNSIRTLAEADVGSNLRDAAYAAPKMTTVESREIMVVASISGVSVGAIAAM